MNILIEPVIRESKVNNSGLVPVCLRLTSKGVRSYHSLKIRIPVSAWVDGEIAKSYPNADLLNEKIRQEKGKIERELLNRDVQGENVTLNSAKSLLKVDKGQKDFLHYALHVVMPELEKTTKHNTHRLKIFQYNKLKEFSPKLQFADITPQFLTRFYKHLTLREKAAIKNNSTIEVFKFIKQVFNHARACGVTTIYPFDEWKMPQYEAPHKVYLTLDECKEIEKILHKKVSAEMKTVVAFFLLECYSGIRFSDWDRFEIEKVTEAKTMKLITAKTDKRVTLPIDLMPSLKRIVEYIDQHDMKFGYTGQYANRILKQVADMCEIEKHLTTHVGRHTYATQMLSIGVSKEAIASSMGVSVKVVNTYAKIVPDKLKNELLRIGGGI